MTDGDIEKARQEVERIRREDVPRVIQQEMDRANAALAESQKRHMDWKQKALNDSYDIGFIDK